MKKTWQRILAGILAISLAASTVPFSAFAEEAAETAPEAAAEQTEETVPAAEEPAVTEPETVPEENASPAAEEPAQEEPEQPAAPETAAQPGENASPDNEEDPEATAAPEATAEPEEEILPEEEELPAEEETAAADDEPEATPEPVRTEPETFNGDNFVDKLDFTLTSGDTTVEYHLSNGQVVDTTGDFTVVERSAEYVGSITLDVKKMALAAGTTEDGVSKYPLIPGDTVECTFPTILNENSSFSGRLHDTTTDWDELHDGVGSFTISNGKLTLTYDEGYLLENSGKVLSSTVQFNGGFNLEGMTNEEFDEVLNFGNASVKLRFSMLEIKRNLSIEKTGTKDTGSTGGYYYGSYYGSAYLDSAGYLHYTVTVTAKEDNTVKLTNVEVTDIFKESDQSKVDLSTMTLVSVTKDGASATAQATPLYDEQDRVNGWNIGTLEIGQAAVIEFKIKLNKDGVSEAVKAEKEAEGYKDGAETARSLTNTATATADYADPVSDDYTTSLKNKVSISKSASNYDAATQTKYFTSTLTVPSTNRYTMYGLVISDYISSYSSYFSEAGIRSITVKHSDGTTEDVAWENFEGNNYSWSATLPVAKPGDTFTIKSYAKVSDTLWSKSASNGLVSISPYNYIYAGSTSVANSSYAHASNDISRVYYSAYFTISKIFLQKTGGTPSNGKVSWSVTGNEIGKSSVPVDLSGQTLTDTLGENQKFQGNLTIYFYSLDASGNRVQVGSDTIVPDESMTSFSYTIPAQYGMCEFRLSYYTDITDWDTYVGAAKSYYNTIGLYNWHYTVSSYQRTRVAAMSKYFVQQDEDWAEWKTQIYSAVDNGDVYTDASNNVSYMYFTQANLDAMTLTIDGIAVDSSLYEVKGNFNSSGRAESYTITFKGAVSVTENGTVVKPSSSHPLVILYRTTMVNPTLSNSRDYTNTGTLKTTDGFTDSDYDYCRRAYYNEISKTYVKTVNSVVTWHLRLNTGGYAPCSDGSVILEETIPAGQSFVSAYLEGKNQSCSLGGNYKTYAGNNAGLEILSTTENADGTTTVKMKVTGLVHYEYSKSNTSASTRNSYVEQHLYVTTRITDEEYLYGYKDNTFSYTNKAALHTRYGEGTASATMSIQHVAMTKEMNYSAATAPYAYFTVLVNKDKADLNPDGDTIELLDISSSTLNVSPESVAVVDAVSGVAKPFTIDASAIADGRLVLSAPDAAYLKITYKAYVVGLAGEEVKVENAIYYKDHENYSTSNSVSQRIVVMNSSGQSKSEPMFWLKKQDMKATQLAGAKFVLEEYRDGAWSTTKSSIVSTNTSSKGTKVESLELNVLYRLSEVEAPEGYIKSDDYVYIVLLEGSDDTTEYPEGFDTSVVNKRTPGSAVNVYNQEYAKFSFRKLSTDGVQLSGGKYRVLNADGTTAKDKNGKTIEFTASATEAFTCMLAPGEYQLVEVTPPDGYQANDPVSFTAKGNGVIEWNGKTVDEITMTDETEYISIPVTKIWNDDSDRDGVRADSVTVHLYADGEDTGKSLKLNAAGEWKGSFDDLPVMVNGNKVAYTVTEDEVTDYTTGITGSAADGYVVTNTHETAKTSVTVYKVWDDEDDQDGIRDSYTVTLYENGEPSTRADAVQTLDKDTLTYTWENIPANLAGKAIEYTVVETGIPDGYTAAVTEGSPAADDEDAADEPADDTVVEPQAAAAADDADANTFSFTITNSHVPTTMNISGTKTWVGDKEKSRPKSITVSLYNGKTVVQTVTVTPDADGSWNFTFVRVPKYNEDGSDAVYTVKEKSVSGYKATYDGYNITNTKTSKKPEYYPDPTPDPDTVTPASVPTPAPSSSTGVKKTTPTATPKKGANGETIDDNETPLGLPHTGQLWWPVFLLLAAGAALVFIALPKRRNGKHQR